MAPLISESLDRRLNILESVNLRLHLMVCSWCALYLKQLELIRVLTGKKVSSGGASGDTLSSQARERITLALEKSGAGHSSPDN